MISKKSKIENVLSNAEQILIRQPDLYNMSLKNVIASLNETEQLIRDRWGVTALLVIKSIKNWQIPNLVRQLTLVESGDLTYEYVGFLLLNEYDVDLEALLLEADQQNKYNCIVKYVSPNLRFLTRIKPQYISSLLQMAEKHIENNSYNCLLSNYAKGVANCNAFHTVTDSLGEVCSKTQYDFIYFLAKEWYHSNTDEANQQAKVLLDYSNIWSKKAAIDWLGISLLYDRTEFEVQLSKIEEIILESNELWLQTIYVFVRYLFLWSENEDKNVNYDRVLEYLQRIPKDSTVAKHNFLNAIQWEKDLTKDIQDIFNSIIITPFESDKCPLHILDNILCGQIHDNDFEIVVKNMLDVFVINKYHYKYADFFDGLSSTISKLSKYSNKLTKIALTYMLTNNIDLVFFGLACLIQWGDAQTLIDIQENGDLNLTNIQMINVIKAVLYFSVMPSKICNLSFQLLAILKDSPDKYITFCMDEVYENYPGTMFDVSKIYINSSIVSQIKLAELVSNAHEKTLCEYEQSSKINDLRPSSEHQYIYRKALQKQNKQITKNATKKSILDRIFVNRTLKYGARSGHVIQGAKNEKNYQSSPYRQIKHEIEIPRSYVIDPVGYEIKKITFYNEVTKNENDN